jgi:hypothetical protein
MAKLITIEDYVIKDNYGVSKHFENEQPRYFGFDIEEEHYILDRKAGLSYQKGFINFLPNKAYHLEIYNGHLNQVLAEEVEDLDILEKIGFELGIKHIEHKISQEFEY